jgi:hypothetical protein
VHLFCDGAGRAYASCFTQVQLQGASLWRHRPSRRIACIGDDLSAAVGPHELCNNACRSRRSATANASCILGCLGIVMQAELVAIAPMVLGSQAPTSTLSPSACPQAIASQPEPSSCLSLMQSWKSLSEIKASYRDMHTAVSLAHQAHGLAYSFKLNRRMAIR